MALVKYKCTLLLLLLLKPDMGTLNEYIRLICRITLHSEWRIDYTDSHIIMAMLPNLPKLVSSTIVICSRLMIETSLESSGNTLSFSGNGLTLSFFFISHIH